MLIFNNYIPYITFIFNRTWTFCFLEKCRSAKIDQPVGLIQYQLGNFLLAQFCLYQAPESFCLDMELFFKENLDTGKGTMWQCLYWNLKFIPLSKHRCQAEDFIHNPAQIPKYKKVILPTPWYVTFQWKNTIYFPSDFQNHFPIV